MSEPKILDYASPTRYWRHSVIGILALSFAMAFVFAITFVIIMTLTLPKTDGAYGEMPFSDPLVFPVMAVGASVAALVAFPFVYFSLRSRPLGRSVAMVGGITMVELILVTPFNAGAGFWGSFVAFAIGLLLAHRLGKPTVVGGG